MVEGYTNSLGTKAKGEKGKTPPKGKITNNKIVPEELYNPETNTAGIPPIQNTEIIEIGRRTAEDDLFFYLLKRYEYCKTIMKRKLHTPPETSQKET